MLIIPLILMATIAGLVVAPIYSLPSVPGLLAAVVFLAAALFLRHFPRLFLLSLCLGFLLIANVRYPHQLRATADVVAIGQLARKVVITGMVTDVTALNDGRSRVNMLADEVHSKQGAIALPDPLRVRVSVEEGAYGLLPGDRIRFSGRLRQPRQFGTPGEFNWPRYLASQGMEMTSWVRSMEQIDVLARQELFPARRIVDWRSRVAATMTETLSEQRAILVRALVLGEGRQLPDEVRKLLAGAGVSHLFAISGLHLGLLGIFGYQFLLLFYRRSTRLLNWQPPQRFLPLLLLPLLFGYLLLTGDAVSTRRAFVLACVGAAVLWWRYPINPLHLLATVALLFLVFNPLLLWQAGWQLSFCGAAGILLWRPLWQRRDKEWNLPQPVRYLIQIFLVTCAATLATLPFVLLNFHLFAPAGIVANLICVPVVTLAALPLGFLGLMLYPLLPQMSVVLFQLCGMLLEAMVGFAAWLTAFPLLEGRYFFLSRGQYLAVALGLLPLLCAPQFRFRVAVAAKVTLLSWLSALLLWTLPWSSQAPVTLTLFSVGQGESMLLQNRQGQNLLIDGGGLYSPRFDVGERLLAPAFGELGVDQFDYVLLTHNHADHWKGLVFVLNHFPVGELLLGQTLSRYHPDLIEVVSNRQIPFRVVESDWSKVGAWSEGALSVYNGRMSAESENDSSLAVHLDFDSQGILLTGDLEAQGIRNLLAAQLPGTVSVLKLPHHGSRRSGTEQLVEEFQPQIGLVSVGYQNIYRQPARQVISVLAESQVPLFRTDLDGSLRVRMEASGFQVQSWQNGLFR